MKEETWLLFKNLDVVNRHFRFSSFLQIFILMKNLLVGQLLKSYTTA